MLHPPSSIQGPPSPLMALQADSGPLLAGRTSEDLRGPLTELGRSQMELGGPQTELGGSQTELDGPQTELGGLRKELREPKRGLGLVGGPQKKLEGP